MPVTQVDLLPRAGPAPTKLDPAYVAESKTAMILTVVTIFHVLALLFIGMRTYTRIFIIRVLGRDDYVIIASGACAFGGWVVFVVQAYCGLGRHNDTIAAPDLARFSHAGFWQSIISTSASLGLLKISIALSLLRLATGSARWFSWTLWGLIVFVSAYQFMGMMTFFLHCFPMQFHWDKTIKDGWCYDISLFVTFALVNTSFNIFTDVLCATLPIPLIWNLQLNLKSRLYIIGILSLGYMAVAMGIVKAIYQIAYSGEKDRTYLDSIPFWGFLQLQLGIIAACAPTLKQLFSNVLGLVTTNKPSRLYDHDYDREPGHSLATIGGTRRAFYKAEAATTSGNKSVSEEMILQGVTASDKFKGGIVRTTQVTVR